MPPDPVLPERPAHNTIPRFCVVVPVYNEDDNIVEFHRRLSLVMNNLGAWQVIYVNDGSTDGTLPLLLRLQENDEHVALVNLSRNFGKEAALTAGLDHAMRARRSSSSTPTCRTRRRSSPNWSPPGEKDSTSPMHNAGCAPASHG